MVSRELSHSVRRAIDYIEAQYPHIESIPEIAEAIEENYHNLRTRFRRETGQTLEEYLIRTRLKEAAALLRETNLLVKEICWQVGYTDEAHFGKRFREHYGATPLSYRYRKRMSRLITDTLAKLKRYIR